MRSSWPHLLLGDVAASQPGAIAIGPFGSRLKAETYTSSGVALIRGTNLAGSKFLAGDFVFIPESTASGLGHANVSPWDLVFPHRGNIGAVGIVPKGSQRFALSTSLMKVTLDRARVDPLFMYYFFRSALGQSELLKNASQVGTPGIATPLTSLRSCVVPVPSLREQTAASRLLSLLDDRIDLLRQTNATLESIAQALFKSWFIDFDPVRAKMKGREPEAMNANTAALFPDRLDAVAQGAVPVGWNYCSLREVAAIFDSQRIPLSGAERAKRKGHYPYYGAASLMDHVDDYLFDGVYLLLGEDGSVADENGRPISQYVWGKFWVNNHAHVLQGKNGVSTEHLMLALQRMDIRPYVTGAVQAKLSQSNMWRMTFVRPPRQVSEAFAGLVAPLYSSIRQNAETATTLSSLRDTLLPRLISGQLRLTDSESSIEVLA